jgi:hypothetical protein
VDQGKGVSVTERGRGKLQVVSDTWDFGYIPQEASVTHRYILENVGDDTLFIEEVKPTCGCTVANLAKNRLAPSDKVPVEVTFSSKKFSGPITKMVHVISSDGATTRYPLTFKAEVGANPAMGLDSGTAIAFYEVPVNESRSVKYPLTNLSETPVKVAIVDAPPEYIKASLSAATVDAKQSVTLMVETGAGKPLGKFGGSVTVDVTGAQKTRLTIPITGIGKMQ